VNAGTDAQQSEDEQRGRKLPLFLLFLGPPGPSLSASKIALRRLPGVELHSFSDPETALDWARDNDVVAAVVDDHRPAADGVAFLRRLQNRPGAGPHTILVSDAPEVSAPGRARVLGIDDIVSLAVPRANLVALLRGAIGLRQSERASWEQTQRLERSPAWAAETPAPPSGRVKRVAAVAGAFAIALMLLALLRHPPSPAPLTASAPAVPTRTAVLASTTANVGVPIRAVARTDGQRAPAASPPPPVPGAATSDVAVAPVSEAVPAVLAGANPAALPLAGAAAATDAGPPAQGAAAPPAHSAAALTPPAGFIILNGTGGVIASEQPDVPRTPASTLKLLTAVTALAVLGSTFRFTTTLVAHGAIANGTLAGPLAFVGGGDPVLRSEDVEDGVIALARRGVHHVRGDLVIDATAFSTPEYNAHWSAAERRAPYAAGTSAVAIDEGVRDGAAVLDQATFAGTLLRDRLRAHDISVDGATRYGSVPTANGTVAWAHHSPPLSSLVATMLTQSDNHIAEQLVCEIGRATTGAGSEAAGLVQLRAELTQRGIPTDGLVLDDGSGLAVDDRLTPRMLATLLWMIGSTPLGEQIHAALPRVGTHGDIAAKTGRVADDEGLAGYLDRSPAGSDAFAFFGTTTPHANAGTLQADQERQLRAAAHAVGEARSV
jgi:D-alanyl-D-alanine carboxypeptidase/D-alanyl-D-alanine-endopeptidase (penicillin-binding protein 4)